MRSGEWGGFFFCEVGEQVHDACDVTREPLNVMEAPCGPSTGEEVDHVDEDHVFELGA